MKLNILFLLLITSAKAQIMLSGKVLDHQKPLANVVVSSNLTNLSTKTNKIGEFTIQVSALPAQLQFDLEGYETQKIEFLEAKNIEILMFKTQSLKEVVVKSSAKTLLKPLKLNTNTTLMTSKELLKAACCNLSESFENNPSIDVSFSDAITGAKQIKMLGLTSPYILTTAENIPSVRGAMQNYGLSLVPGTWVESIQVSKGAGSVVNGYESISGQINYEFLKPLLDKPLFINIYGSSDGRFEWNSHYNKKISAKWATTLFVHANTRLLKNDMNNDGFLDNPLGKQINIMNRWQYQNPSTGWITFLNFNVLKDDKKSGENNIILSQRNPNLWESEVQINKADFSSKVGYVFKDKPFQSIGFQNAFTHYKQDAFFDTNQYFVKQNSYYSNLVFNSIIGSTMHKFATGLQFVYDHYNEYFVQNTFQDWSRADRSIGTFFEYTYDNMDNFGLVAGLRADSHNRMGNFVTPRLHLRYNPWEKAVLRASVGRGKRAANIFAENQGLMASKRNFEIQQNNGAFYGLPAEIAWNMGVSFGQNFLLFGKKMDFTIDFYRTDFDKQAVIDLDFHPQKVLIYGLEGKSFANSFQLDLNYEPFQRFGIRTAYKFLEVKTQFKEQFLDKTLQPKHRFFANFAYETTKVNQSQWKFDFTYNFIGSQRFADTSQNPSEVQLPNYSPNYSVMNAQITKVFSDKFEVYLGAENLGNYRAKYGILGNQPQWRNYLDTSMIYGPVFGSMYFGGLRFKN